MKTFTIDAGLAGRERLQLAAALETAAAMAGSANPDHIAVSFMRVLAARVEAADGPVTMRLALLDDDGAAIVRRIIYSAASRAKEQGENLAVTDAMGRILAAWERAVHYDPQPGYSGPRNPWGEPVVTHKRLARI